MRPCWHELDDETPDLLDLELGEGMQWALNDLQYLHQGKAPPVMVVAVSGGLDSTCLLSLLWCSAKRSGVQLHVAHLDHGLRPESAADAAFVRDLAEQMGLPFHCERAEINLGAGSGGLEAAARRARYGFLARVARAVTPPGVTPCVLTAHHADDQAETVLLNLARSDGYKGIQGMEFCSAMPEQGRGRRVYLLRPLLRVRRAELLEYGHAHKILWREDFTNAIPERPRTLIRHKILPELEKVNRSAVRHVADSVRWAQQRDRFSLRAWKMVYRLVMVSEIPGERIVFSWEQLQKLKPEEREVLLNDSMLREKFRNVHIWGRRQISPMLRRLEELPAAGGPYPLTDSLSWSVLPPSSDGPALLVIHRADVLPVAATGPWLDEQWRATVGSLPLLVPGCTAAGDYRLEATLLPAPLDLTPASLWEATFDHNKAGDPALTYARPGMRIAPLGMKGQTRALGDIFTDKKIPPALREGWPVVIDQRTARVLWLCGLVMGHDAAVSGETTSALRLRWLPEDREEET